MKHMIAILLLVLMLSACMDAAVTVVTVVNTTQVTEPVSTAETAEQTVIEETTTAKTIPPNVFMIPGELPDIGEFSGNNKENRFYEAYTPDFIPSDEYGMIIPYVGSYKVYETKDDGIKTTQGYATYGFCTPDGKIVMDASSKTYSVYYRETDDGFGYYSVSRGMKLREDAPDEYYADETLLIPISGEWCLTFNQRAWVNQAGGGVVLVSIYSDDYTNERVEVYDYSGNKISEFSGYDSYGIYTNGLIAASKWDDKDGYSVSYINLDGELVLGPYKSAGTSTESGLTYIKDKNDDYYFIDKSGKRLSRSYENIQLNYGDNGRGNVFVATCKDDGGTDVFDLDLNLLGHTDQDRYLSFSFPKNGEILYYYYDYDSGDYDTQIWKRLSDGSDFVSKEFSVYPNYYSSSNDMFINYDSNTKKAIIFDGDGETIVVLDNIESVGNISADGRYFVYMTGTYDYEAQIPMPLTPIQFHVYDTLNKTDVYVLEKDGYANFIGNDARYILFSVYDEFSMFGGFDGYYLYDTNTNQMVLSDANYIGYDEIGGEWYFNVCIGNSYSVYDGNMNLIMKSYKE